MPGRTFKSEFKLQVVREIELGLKRPAQVCREHNLDESVVLRWRHQDQQRGEAAFTAKASGEVSEQEVLERRVEELERLCGQLALENSVLKKFLEKSRQSGGSK